MGVDLSGAYLREQAWEGLGLDALKAWEEGAGREVEECWKDTPLFAGVEG